MHRYQYWKCSPSLFVYSISAGVKACSALGTVAEVGTNIENRNTCLPLKWNEWNFQKLSKWLLLQTCNGPPSQCILFSWYTLSECSKFYQSKVQFHHLHVPDNGFEPMTFDISQQMPSALPLYLYLISHLCVRFELSGTMMRLITSNHLKAVDTIGNYSNKLFA